MLNTFATRARFYDITGYLFPGQILIFVIWSYIRVFDNADFAWQIVKHIQDNWMAALVLVFLAGAYVLGHVVNSASSLIVEKWLLNVMYVKSADWVGRLRDDKTDRGKVVLERFKEVFGYEAQSRYGADVGGWADHFIPNAAMTSFRFLSFYGMCRTLALLTVAESVPVLVWTQSRFGCVAVTVWIALALMIVFLLFLHQYFRFVRYYTDFNATLLLIGTGESCGKKESAV